MKQQIYQQVKVEDKYTIKIIYYFFSFIFLYINFFFYFHVNYEYLYLNESLMSIMFKFIK